MHAERQLVGFDACAQRGVGRVFDGCGAIQFIQKLELAALFLLEDVGAGRHEGKGLIRISFEIHTGVLRAEITRPVRARAATTISGRLAQHDEGRQIRIQCAEAVVYP